MQAQYKRSSWQMFFKITVRPATLLEIDFITDVFLWNLRNFKNTFFYRTPLLCNKVFLEACNFMKKRLLHRCFPVNFVKFLRTPFFIEHPWWLPLSTLVAASGSKLCKTMKTYIEHLCCRERNDLPLQYV